MDTWTHGHMDTWIHGHMDHIHCEWKILLPAAMWVGMQERVSVFSNEIIFCLHVLQEVLQHSINVLVSILNHKPGKGLFNSIYGYISPSRKVTLAGLIFFILSTIMQRRSMSMERHMVDHHEVKLVSHLYHIASRKGAQFNDRRRTQVP